MIWLLTLPFRIVSTAAVPHDGCKSVSNDLLGALRASDIDERIISSIRPAPMTRARPRPLFLKLVATVVRQARYGVRTDDFQAS